MRRGKWRLPVGVWEVDENFALSYDMSSSQNARWILPRDSIRVFSQFALRIQYAKQYFLNKSRDAPRCQMDLFLVSFLGWVA